MNKLIDKKPCYLELSYYTTGVMARFDREHRREVAMADLVGLIGRILADAKSPVVVEIIEHPAYVDYPESGRNDRRTYRHTLSATLTKARDIQVDRWVMPKSMPIVTWRPPKVLGPLKSLLTGLSKVWSSTGLGRDGWMVKYDGPRG